MQGARPICRARNGRAPGATCGHGRAFTRKLTCYAHQRVNPASRRYELVMANRAEKGFTNAGKLV